MLNPYTGNRTFGNRLQGYKMAEVATHAIVAPTDTPRMGELAAEIKSGKGKYTSSSYAPSGPTMDERAARMREKYGKRKRSGVR